MWYHGSREKFNTLKRHHAVAPEGAPPEERLNVIYLDFALAMAAGPQGGLTEISHGTKTIFFENTFDPEKEVYIYFVDPSKIPEQKKIFIDEWQIAADIDEITPDKVERHKAGEVSQYYSIIGE
jgi:hypothetical protein